MNSRPESPLKYIDLDFDSYVLSRRKAEAEHSINDIPDYAFPLDHELHRKLEAIPLFQTACRSVMATIATSAMEDANLKGVAVGPNQFPEIYQMGADCAKRLGIGVPNIYIIHSPEINAYTIPIEDSSAMIVIYSGLLERFHDHPGELKSIIAHECGHIHNNHGVFQNVIRFLVSPKRKGTWAHLFGMGTKLMMTQWSRAMEVTADRAAIICSDDPQDFINSEARLMSGAMLNMDYQLNLDELRRQLEESFRTPGRIQELAYDHPTGTRRIVIGQEFIESDVLYRWRPEWKVPGMTVRPISEVNERCQKLVNLFDNEIRR